MKSGAILALLALGICAAAVSEDTAVEFSVEELSRLRVKQVFETQHLPKQQLKTPADQGAAPDFDINDVMRKMEEDKKRNEGLMDKLRKAGVNTEGMNFGGGFGNMDPDQLAKMLKNFKGAAPPPQPAAADKEQPDDVEEIHEEL